MLMCVVHRWFRKVPPCQLNGKMSALHMVCMHCLRGRVEGEEHQIASTYGSWHNMGQAIATFYQPASVNVQRSTFTLAGWYNTLSHIMDAQSNQQT